MRTLINYETFLQSEKMNGKFILKGNERGRTLEEKSMLCFYFTLNGIFYNLRMRV